VSIGVIPSAIGDVVVAAFSADAGSIVSSPTSPWVLQPDQDAEILASAYQITTTTSTKTAAWQLSGGTTWNAVIVDINFPSTNMNKPIVVSNAPARAASY
jgi:hypothetical protein